MGAMKEQYIANLEAAIARAKREVLEDVMKGIVDRTCSSYSELHNYVDANYYGGAFEDDAHDITDMDFWNAMQDEVNDWIAAGGINEGFVKVKQTADAVIEILKDQHGISATWNEENQCIVMQLGHGFELGAGCFNGPWGCAVTDDDDDWEFNDLPPNTDDVVALAGRIATIYNDFWK